MAITLKVRKAGINVRGLAKKAAPGFVKDARNSRITARKIKKC